MSAAEVLAQHRKTWNVSVAVAKCTAPGCDWSSAGNIARTDAAHAAHQLVALKAAGYAVVELPKRCLIPSGWDRECLGAWSAEGVGFDPVSAWPLSGGGPGGVSLPDGIRGAQFISVEAARNLAAALLAAAEAAS